MKEWSGARGAVWKVFVGYGAMLEISRVEGQGRSVRRRGRVVSRGRLRESNSGHDTGTLGYLVQGRKRATLGRF